MSKNWVKIFFLVLITSMGWVEESAAQNDKEHVEVALRAIGHELLLQANDSTSLVLPIKSEQDKFRINFASSFHFSPENLITSVDSIFKLAKIGGDYRLEMMDVDQGEVVHSYEAAAGDSGLITCIAREYPEANYSVLVTLLDDQGQPKQFKDESSETDQKNDVSHESSSSTGFITMLVLLALLLIIGWYFWRNKNRGGQNAEISQIGKYRFDQRNMKLIFKKESIDLTSKETDLLTLLHSSIDQTIEREKILQVVWGDEGDYVGRTLDVFISKLRKKFSDDANVKIVNVRGVGYKLMLSEAN